MNYFADVGALARKDLRLELRARDTLPAMLLFVLSTLVIFHFVLPGDSSELAAKGLLWVAIVFTALLGLSRAFAAEREQGMIDGLVLAPSDRARSGSARRSRVLAFLALAELVALPAFALFFGGVSGSCSRASRSRMSASPRSEPCSPRWPPPAAPASCSCRCSSYRLPFRSSSAGSAPA